MVKATIRQYFKFKAIISPFVMLRLQKVS